jgi:ergothioneine biosynthesis protein EgtB
MEHCRSVTLARFDTIEDAQLRQQVHPDFSPIGWHLGHIGYTEALWLLEPTAQGSKILAEYRRLFAADGLPKSARTALPSLAEIKDYLAAVRAQVFELLPSAPLEAQERLWWWLLQHESQHCETIAIVQTLQTGVAAIPVEPLHVNSPATDMVLIPAGCYACGSEAVTALDNERPVHSVSLPDFWIDRHPITCAQFAEFINQGGYQESRWWSPEGWIWQQAAQVTRPLYWTELSHANHPVCGVSWYEADAYARFVGKRLPTEAEWEAAASWQPDTAQSSLAFCHCGQQADGTAAVDRPSGQISPSGCIDLLGNVWEWTATWFEGYPDFTAYPYRGYSQAYFDRQHRVLKGGSWATLPWALRSTFRNWYHPQVREVFAGFRCVAERG